MSYEEEIEALFPNLRNTPYHITSPRDIEYNCIAFAAGSEDQLWWPSRIGRYFWPPGVPREETLEAFVLMFRTLDFGPCEVRSAEPGFEKVAIYTQHSLPTHAARQLRSGMWTSKLGEEVDIVHTLEGLENSDCGTVARILKRPCGY